jgi:low affinity Fe/Cu permease
VTAPQLGYLENLGKALHLTLDELVEKCRATQPNITTLLDLTKRNASQIIDAMQQENQRARAFPTAPHTMPDPQDAYEEYAPEDDDDAPPV